MDFNPRSPCGERQSPQTVREGVITYFNPRSPCGERLAAVMIDGEATLFQSTLSLRRATIPPGLHHFPNRNFNPRSPCGERPGPLTGPAPLRYFNPRSPCGERPSWQLPFEPSYPFQSTLSLRRATSGSGSNWSRVAYFNPRSPCGERHPTHQERGCGRYFNPRSPCGERPGPMVRLNSTITFQSTLSLRRATGSPFAPFKFLNAFQSTLSLRRATVNLILRLQATDISIHALLAESDIHGRLVADPETNFNPRSPCGERQVTDTYHGKYQDFNPRSPCGERPERGRPERGTTHNFNPRSPCGERHFLYPLDTLLLDFNPRSPCGERLMEGARTTMTDGFQSTLSLRRAT